MQQRRAEHVAHFVFVTVLHVGRFAHADAEVGDALTVNQPILDQHDVAGYLTFRRWTMPLRCA